MTLLGMDHGDDENTPLTDAAKPAAIATATSHVAPPDRKYLLERVDDAAVAQLYADGFSSLPLDQKILIWHLYQAALAGRDIYYDQRYAHNLEMRDVLEEILTHSGGVDPGILAEIQRYTKLFWLNTGPHNNLTARKFVLKCTPEAFRAAAHAAAASGATFPLRAGETVDDLIARMQPLFFNPNIDTIVTNKTPGSGKDILSSSANNLYVGVSMKDLDGLEEKHPINSRVVKNDGRIVEEVYRIGGKYDKEIQAIVRHLEAAIPYATPTMATALRALVRFYRTGLESDRIAYDIAWVQDKESPVDTINGFVEVYMDPRGMKGAWEALVFYVNREKTEGIRRLAASAQWFEDRMPWAPQYRKEGVRGITANAIDVVVESGDSGPITPVGINLPNDQDIREKYGSKSVSLSNVNEAYDKSTSAEFRKEFAWSAEEAERAERWSSIASELTTDLHEVIGHASGKIAEHLKGSPQSFLKEQYSALEESRADLVALYFLPDPRMVELGLIDAADHEQVVLAEYEGYARNALVQLRRIREGTQIEEDHMRNRQMIVQWLLANSSAIEVRRRDNKTYYAMVDVTAFREAVGRLLAEVQRIKAEGDYGAAKGLFETYGVHFDPALRDEVVARVEHLNMPSYTGFVQPRLEPVRAADGTITDVAISYPLDFTKQMLEYSGRLK
ncbi:MAG: dipeptidyl-peptidase 3 family protein [Vicinamibacterales bacterium]